MGTVWTQSPVKEVQGYSEGLCEQINGDVLCWKGGKYALTHTSIKRDMCAIIIHLGCLQRLKAKASPWPRSHCQKGIKEQQYS